MKYTLIVLALIAFGCGSSPVAPTITDNSAVVTYDIHIPDPLMAVNDILTYPNGVGITPATAQRLYDYSATYGQSNVLAAGSCQPVPLSMVARWHGQFVYTPVGRLCP